MSMLSIIIVSYNTRNMLRNCLLSLCSANIGVNHEIIVVDNASSDGSCTMIKKDFPKCILIQNDHNRLFSGANNQAVLQAVGRYLLFLNSDTLVPAGQIELLISFLESHPTVAAVGPRECDFENNIRSEGFAAPGIRERFCECFKLAAWPLPLPLKRLLCPIGTRGLDCGTTQPVGWISGSCMLVRHETVKAIGGFSEAIGFYGEEVEWCWRATQHGYGVWVLPQAHILHKGGGSVVGKPALSIKEEPFQFESYTMLQRLTVGIPRSVVMSLIVTTAAFFKMLVCIIGARSQWRQHAIGIIWELRVISHLCTTLWHDTFTLERKPGPSDGPSGSLVAPRNEN